MFYDNGKNNKANYLILLALVALLLPAGLSAQLEFFSPHEAYLMGLKQKFDLKVGASLLPLNKPSRYGNPAIKTQQYSGQVAFSPWNRIGVIGSFSQKKGNYTESPVAWNSQHLEFGVGTYHQFRRAHPGNVSIRTNLYLGRGWGNSTSTPITAGEIDLKYHRNFIHSGWQLWWKEYFSFSYGLRFVNLHFNDIEIAGQLPLSFERSLEHIAQKNSINFLEASFQLQGGPKQAQLFISATRPMATLGNDYPLLFSKPVYKIGLILDIGSLYKRF